MNALAFVGILLLAVLVLWGLVVLSATSLAKNPENPTLFARLENGNTYFVNRGEDKKSIWPNIDGHTLSDDVDFEGRHWIVREDDEDVRMKRFFDGTLFGTRWFQKQLWKHNGIRFVSWIPALLSRIHRFVVSRRRLTEEGGARVGGPTPLRNRIVQSPNDGQEVVSLLFVVPRPVYTEGIELAGDNSQINLLLNVVFQQVIPALPVYHLKGDFLALLDSAVSSTMLTFFSSHRVAVDAEGQFVKDTYVKGDEKKGLKPSFLTFAHWTKLDKGDSSPLQAHLRQINASQQFFDEMEADPEKTELFEQLKHLTHGRPTPISNKKIANMVAHGIIPRYGFALISVRIAGWEADEKTAGIAEASKAKEIAKLKADGVREDAYGKRDAAIAQATGEASRFVQMTKALTDQGVTPNMAAEVVRTQIEMEQLNGSGVTTYVRGGKTPGIMVQGSNPAPHAPVSTPATTPPTTPPHSP